MQPESSSHVRNSHVKVFFFLAAQPLVGQGLVVIEESRSYSDTPLSVDLLWTTYQPDLTTLNTQHSKETHVHVLDGIRTRLPSNGAATQINLTYERALKFFRDKYQLILLYFWFYTELFNLAQNWI